MSFRLPNGATFDIETGRAVSKAITAMTNANPAVASAAAHGLDDGDVVVVTDGWAKVANRAARITDLTDGTFGLIGIDTRNVNLYPVGLGAGKYEEVTGWVQLKQVTEPTTSGGEQQFANVAFLESDMEFQIPTTTSAATLSLPVADDPEQAYLEVVEAADQDKEPRVVRLNLPNGSKIHYFAYISITKTPTLARNNIMTRTVTLALQGVPTRYNPA